MTLCPSGNCVLSPHVLREGQCPADGSIVFRGFCVHLSLIKDTPKVSQLVAPMSISGL